MEGGSRVSGKFPRHSRKSSENFPEVLVNKVEWLIEDGPSVK